MSDVHQLVSTLVDPQIPAFTTRAGAQVSNEFALIRDERVTSDVIVGEFVVKVYARDRQQIGPKGFVPEALDDEHFVHVCGLEQSLFHGPLIVTHPPTVEAGDLIRFHRVVITDAKSSFFKCESCGAVFVLDADGYGPL